MRQPFVYQDSSQASFIQTMIQVSIIQIVYDLPRPRFDLQRVAV